MKIVIALCVLALVGLSLADYAETYARGCIYVEGRCTSGCEEGTHAYAVGCAQITPEPTCDEPNPVKEEGTTCDFSSCYCDPPTVRDTESNKCIPLDKCPKKAKN